MNPKESEISQLVETLKAAAESAIDYHTQWDWPEREMIALPPFYSQRVYLAIASPWAILKLLSSLPPSGAASEATFEEWFDKQAEPNDEDYPSQEAIGFAEAAWNAGRASVMPTLEQLPPLDVTEDEIEAADRIAMGEGSNSEVSWSEAYRSQTAALLCRERQLMAAISRAEALHED
jgi:hypothetical protein